MVTALQRNQKLCIVLPRPERKEGPSYFLFLTHKSLWEISKVDCFLLFSRSTSIRLIALINRKQRMRTRKKCTNKSKSSIGRRIATNVILRNASLALGMGKRKLSLYNKTIAYLFFKPFPDFLQSFL